MNGSLLDTNAIIKCIQGDPKAESMFERLLSPIFIPATVVGELYFGAYKSKRYAENIALLQAFIACYEILPITPTVADKYGELKASLSRRGINLPENDIWIASCALYNGLFLATFDSHFSLIEELRSSIIT